MKLASCALLLLGSPILAGCTTCVSGDLDCVMTHLSPTLDGNPIDFVRIPADRVLSAPAPSSTSGAESTDSLQFLITPLSAPNFGDPVAMIQSGVSAKPGIGSGGQGAAPAITNKLPAITLSSDQPVSLEVDFTDPNGMTPTFCFQACKADGTWCYPHWVYCTNAVRDNRLGGPSLFQFRPNATFDRPFIPGVPTLIEPTPIEPTPIEASVIHPTPILGQPAPVMITFPTPGQSGPPGGGPGDYTACQSAPIACAKGNPVCSIQACASSDSGCTGGYKISDGTWIACASCSNCTSAAMAAVSHCCPAN